MLLLRIKNSSGTLTVFGCSYMTTMSQFHDFFPGDSLRRKLAAEFAAQPPFLIEISVLFFCGPFFGAAIYIAIAPHNLANGHTIRGPVIPNNVRTRVALANCLGVGSAALPAACRSWFFLWLA
jgi:hypothetical protein